jgi:beta-phosphoglucomutase-like phosphatase (HAD superfamily)
LQLLKTANGSAKQELETTFEENIGSKNFDIIVTDGDLEGHEKPNTKPFQTALQRMNLKPSELRTVENSLGVEGFRRKTVNLIQERLVPSPIRNMI